MTDIRGERGGVMTEAYDWPAEEYRLAGDPNIRTESCDIDDMIGEVFSVVRVGEIDGNEALIFESDGTRQFVFTHAQECCESVAIQDIAGSLLDLENAPILVAREVSHEEEGGDGETTWTFYNFSTVKGHVTVRWIGVSNGYYSTSVGYGWDPL